MAMVTLGEKNEAPQTWRHLSPEVMRSDGSPGNVRFQRSEDKAFAFYV
jgi:hypothetical protein